MSHCIICLSRRLKNIRWLQREKQYMLEKETFKSDVIKLIYWTFIPLGNVVLLVFNKNTVDNRNARAKSQFLHRIWTRILEILKLKISFVWIRAMVQGLTATSSSSPYCTSLFVFRKKKEAERTHTAHGQSTNEKKRWHGIRFTKGQGKEGMGSGVGVHGPDDRPDQLQNHSEIKGCYEPSKVKSE